jgi:hypothetical protein
MKFVFFLVRFNIQRESFFFVVIGKLKIIDSILSISINTQLNANYIIAKENFQGSSMEENDTEKVFIFRSKLFRKCHQKERKVRERKVQKM